MRVPVSLYPPQQYCQFLKKVVYLTVLLIFISLITNGLFIFGIFSCTYFPFMHLLWGMTEDEMTGWHYRLDGHESE